MHVLRQMSQAGFFGEFSSAFDLVSIAVYAHDPGAGKSSNLNWRSANAATEVSDDHPGPEPECVRQKMFVAGNRCLEALSGDAGRKVKRPAPSEFVEIHNQVAVEIGDLLLVASFTLQCSVFGFPEAIFVFAEGRINTSRLFVGP